VWFSAPSRKTGTICCATNFVGEGGSRSVVSGGLASRNAPFGVQILFLDPRRNVSVGVDLTLRQIPGIRAILTPFETLFTNSGLG
jgi:hypothetical protein